MPLKRGCGYCLTTTERRKLTPFLLELRSREAHFDQHLLHQSAALVMPRLQPDSHIRGMQHGLIQGPVAHEGKA